jgi:penicillin amidase
MGRIGRIALAGLGVAVGLAALAVWRLAAEAAPRRDGEASVTGLERPAEILRDRRGVPHIVAQSLNDLLFAQGYLHAQERWFTMDLYRRVATGRLSGLVGRNEEVLQNDILMHALGLEALADKDFAALSAEEQQSLQAFANGVNAYLKGRSPAQMALEYRVLALGGYAPRIDPWRPQDALAIARLQAFQLSGRDLDEELHRARAREALGPALYAQWRPGYDYGRHPTVLNPDDLGLPAAANAETPRATPLLFPTPTLRAPLQFLERLGAGAPDSGSNAFAISGAHTQSGLPALAVDPHNGIEMPSAWAEIGLHLRPQDGEAFSIYGWAAAPFPLILEGVNGFAAWGTTNVTGGDALDLFVLEPHPDNPRQYRFDGAWRDFTFRTVSIPIAGAAPVTVELASTVFGPVVPTADGPAIAMRWTGFEPSRIARASLRLAFARNFAMFQDALADWDLPATHFIYAGADGDIGLVTTGRFPIRAPGHSGEFPADGSRTQAQWRGFLNTPDLPALRNPKSGVIASGNNAVVPPAWFDDLRRRRGIDGEADFLINAARGYRGGRIAQRLGEREAHTRDTLAAIQTDVTTPEIARALRPLAALPVSAAAAHCRDLLVQWDGGHGRESAGALVFAYFWETVLQDVYRARLPDGVPAYPGMTELLSLETILANAESGWWDDPHTPETEHRDDRAPKLLDEACTQLRAAHGTDPARQRWGDAFKAHFTNPILGESGIGLFERIGNRTVSVSGGAATVSVGRYRKTDSGFSMVHLPSYRFVVDLGAPQIGLGANSTGQSVHPLSPFYADQMAAWAARAHVEIDFSEPAARAGARHRLVLRPAPHHKEASGV